MISKKIAKRLAQEHKDHPENREFGQPFDMGPKDGEPEQPDIEEEHSDHTAYYSLQDAIEEGIKSLSDGDIRFAYSLNYESNNGFFEQSISQEYFNRFKTYRL